MNGFVTADGVTININSAKALNSVVGHEITHVLEGTELYTELQSAITEYAKSKGDYQGRYDTLTELYKDIEGADIDAELTADLVGDYLFTDADFVKRLSTEHRGVFQKLFDEIKHLCKLATAGTKEARELEKVKKLFEDAYRTETKNPTADGGVKYSITEGMTDAERYAELKDKNIEVAKVQENAILDSYDIEGKSLNDIFKFIRENKESLGLNKVYQKDEIQLEFGYSNRGIKKSIRQTADSKVDEREYLDILSCLDQIIDTSVLIERHGDKSGERNTQLKQVYVLLGAFQKNGVTTPVQLEIKESVGTDNQLYLAVAIKRSGVNATASAEAASVTNPDLSVISIHELIEKINPDAKDFLNYIPDGFLTPEQMEGKKEGIRRDIEKYPNSPFRHISSSIDERKTQQFAIIQENNPMWDDYHTGIRSVEDIRTWEEVLELDDEREGQFVWGDFSREDAEEALKNNSITVYSSHPISNGTFVSTSYTQAWEYAGGNKNAKVYSKEVPLDEVAWINGDEGQYAKVEEDQGVEYSLSGNEQGAAPAGGYRITGEDIALAPTKEDVAEQGIATAQSAPRNDVEELGAPTREDIANQERDKKLQGPLLMKDSLDRELEKLYRLQQTGQIQDNAYFAELFKVNAAYQAAGRDFTAAFNRVAGAYQGGAVNQSAEAKTNAVTKPLSSYPTEKQNAIRSYLQSVDEQIKSFVKRVKGGDLRFERRKVSDVNERAASDIQELLGIDVSGYTHNINTSGVQHILRRHGKNGKQDSTMSVDEDIARVGWVLDNYDSVELLTKDGEQVYSSEFKDKDNNPVPQIRFIKKIDGTYYVVEAACENEYQKLWVQSAYLQKNEDVTQVSAEGQEANHKTYAQGELASPSSNNSILEDVAGVKQKEVEAVLGEKGAYVSKQANALYDEVKSMQKGKRVSNTLSYLLDTLDLSEEHKAESYNSLRTALLNIRIVKQGMFKNIPCFEI